VTEQKAPTVVADRKRYSAIIERYLADCFAARQTVRIKELATLLYASRPYLSRVVPQILGRPLKHVLRDRQMAQAHRLLTETNLPIVEVALASGCGTVSTLYRQFVAVYGQTPVRARRACSDERSHYPQK